MPNCPSCGDLLTEFRPHVRSFTCASCGHWVFVTNGAWADGGRFERSLEAPSFLRVGGELAIDERLFTVGGRVRLGDEDGHWDEWWLADETGSGLWFEEDDGRYLRHESVELALPLDALGSLGVGCSFEAGGMPWFVTEAFAARVLGAEGELPVAFDAACSVRCLDAVAGGRKLSVEIWQDVATASIATPVDAALLVLR